MVDKERNLESARVHGSHPIKHGHSTSNQIMRARKKSTRKRTPRAFDPGLNRVPARAYERYEGL
jgi:hypothetical protein